jgi:serine/threonine protein kinase
MTLAVGAYLGPHEIVSLIGAGGMGEVYQARDTKLGRDVAIKVLPEAFAHDLARLPRFHQKAKTLASLNHPNIAVINRFEEDAGRNYLVMELVPGETLKDGAEVNPDFGSTEMNFRTWAPQRRHGSERGVR